MVRLGWLVYFHKNTNQNNIDNDTASQFLVANENKFKMSKYQVNKSYQTNKKQQQK